jgi:hypothetical protein
VPAAFTGHISAFVSLGDEIVWSGGPTDGDNDLYRLVTDVDEPELLFENHEGDSILTSIAGSAAGYLFTDERWDGGEPRGWRLWFLPEPGADPVLVDESTDDKLIAPTIAMDDHWIAWEVVHGTYDHRVNELRLASVSDPTGSRRSSRIRDATSTSSSRACGPTSSGTASPRTTGRQSPKSRVWR